MQYNIFFSCNIHIECKLYLSTQLNKMELFKTNINNLSFITYHKFINWQGIVWVGKFILYIRKKTETWGLI